MNSSEDLNIVGGFADCGSSVSDGQQTTLSGAGGSGTSVLALAGGTATIKLRLLRLSGGDAPGGGYGGGINYSGNGTLELIETTIDGNDAGYGGGIHFGGTGDAATLTISNDVLIVGNHAAVSGGGIYIERGTMTMAAANSTIYANIAQNYGGGVRVFGTPGEGTRVTVSSAGYGNFAAIEGNEAGAGGGVAVQGLDNDGAGYAELHARRARAHREQLRAPARRRDRPAELLRRRRLRRRLRVRQRRQAREQPRAAGRRGVHRP